MNKKILVYGLVGCALLLLIIFLLASIFVRKDQPGTGPAVTFPNGTATTTTNDSQPQTSINVQNDKSMGVHDFIHNGHTIVDPSNATRYLLAGSLDYCLPDQSCTAVPSDEYTIAFDSTTDTFVVALLKEPLAKGRNDAEKFLSSTLGIPVTQLCQLKYYIGTTYTVNEQYAGSSIGFSTCQGAVRLPS